MSVGSIDKFTMPEFQGISSVVQETQSQKYWTTAKVQKAALIAFGVLAVLATTALIVFLATNPAVSALVLTVSIIGIVVLFGTSVGCFICAGNILDYENASEVKKMKEKALDQTYSQIIKRHGVGKVKKYGIVSEKLLKAKFALEQNTLHFQSIHNATMAAVDAKYPKRQNKLLAELNREKQQINQRVSDNASTVSYASSLAYMGWAPEKEDKNKTFIKADAIGASLGVAAKIFLRQQAQQELSKIDERQQAILKENIGLGDQVKYEEEKKQAKEIFNNALAPFIKEEALYKSIDKEVLYEKKWAAR